MKPAVVKVPGALLLDRNLAPSAKLLWVTHQVLDQHPVTPGLLESRSGLSRHTVLQGLARLSAAGRLPAVPAGHGTARNLASLPDELLSDRTVGVQAKLLYGCLQLLPGFRHPKGAFTYVQLADLTRVSLSTVTRSVRALAETGWIQTTQPNKFCPIQFTLSNSVAARHDGEVGQAARRLEEADYIGEAIMREYLSLLVACDEFEDNASPGFLVNPFTGQEMQFDRYYPPRVAFEFQGPQHYGPTARYSSQIKVQKQQARDYIKAGIAKERGITLITVHPGDLTLQGMQKKAAGLLPLRPLKRHQPLLAFLEAVSRGYRRHARIPDQPDAGA
jgi:hypothetical protein